jgi:hypothetical protein
VRLRGSRPNATSLLREDDLIDIDFLTGNRLERAPNVSSVPLPMGRRRDGDSSCTERRHLYTRSVAPS